MKFEVLVGSFQVSYHKCVSNESGIGDCNGLKLKRWLGDVIRSVSLGKLRDDMRSNTMRWEKRIYDEREWEEISDEKG